MIKKIYNYIYYRTYTVVSQTNTISSISSTGRLLSIVFFLNIMTLYFLFEKLLSSLGFYIFVGLGLVISLCNLAYINNNKPYAIIRKGESLKVKKIWQFLIDYYPDLSLLLLTISFGVTINFILWTLGIIVVLRLIHYFSIM